MARGILITLTLVHLLCGCGTRPAPHQPRQGYVEGAGGVRLYYEIGGFGQDTVVVIHGGPGAGIGDIRPDLGPLMRRHTVIFFDQRGGGYSELPADTTLLSAPLFVDDIEAVRAHFRLTTAYFLAHSFGAVLLAAYAIEHPDRVRAAILLAPTGPSRKQAAQFYMTQPTADTVLAAERYAAMKSLMDGSAADPAAACRRYEELGKELTAKEGRFAAWKGTTCTMLPEAIRYYYRYTAQAGPKSFGAWDFTSALDSVEAPVLVIHGENDAAGFAMDSAWVEAFPNARILRIPSAGRVSYAERPEAVFEAIDAFLGDI